MSLSQEEHNELEAKVHTAFNYPELLTDWEREFTSNMVDKFERFDKVFLSTKQIAIIDKIYEKVTEEIG